MVRKEFSFLHEVIWSNPKLHRNIFDRETTIAEADVEPSQMYNLTQQEASQVELKKNCSAYCDNPLRHDHGALPYIKKRVQY